MLRGADRSRAYYTRKQDTADIHRLIEYNLDELDVEYLRTFFRLFDCEGELDELIGRQE